MLFNSYEFVFLFLPLLVFLFYFCSSRSRSLSATLLIAFSLFFYGWWNWSYVLILVVYVLFNFIWGNRFVLPERSSVKRRVFLGLGILANLSALFYFKYLDFIISTINTLVGTNFPLTKIILPPGISFFAFTSIAYLIDVFRKNFYDCSFLHFSLFQCFFPHLVAGPILRPSEVIPQLDSRDSNSFSPLNFSCGMSLFTLGLFKKVILADNFSLFVDPSFSATAKGHLVYPLDGWVSALSYTFQLYFDFSGYSDMAIGLAKLFNITFPSNFTSPYKATSIIEFWRRWHMSLARWCRDYIYIPLGGNRKGALRRYVNLFLTMFVVGIWHGAGLTFVVWGVWHGLLLVANHLIRSLVSPYAEKSSILSSIILLFSAPVTFLCVMFGWIVFRAESLSSAWGLMKCMFAFQGMSLPLSWRETLLSSLSLEFVAKITFTPHVFFKDFEAVLWLFFGLLLVFFSPNTLQIMGRAQPVFEETSPLPRFFGWLSWRPTPVFALVCAVLLTTCIVNMTKSSPYLYFQF